MVLQYGFDWRYLCAILNQFTVHSAIVGVRPADILHLLTPFSGRVISTTELPSLGSEIPFPQAASFVR